MTDLQETLKYKFNNEELLHQALTHSSAEEKDASGHRFDNERLEFLGDAYLDAVIGKLLFDRLPELQEGALSRLRAKIVCERSLAGIARTCGIDRALRIGGGAEKSGVRGQDSVIADAVEALIGAVLTDGGYAVCADFILRIFDATVQAALAGALFDDYKSALQEYVQRKGPLEDLQYVPLGETGPDHSKTFTVAAAYKGRIIGRGTGKSRKAAEQCAAREALDALEAAEMPGKLQSRGQTEQPGRESMEEDKPNADGREMKHGI